MTPRTLNTLVIAAGVCLVTAFFVPGNLWRSAITLASHSTAGYPHGPQLVIRHGGSPLELTSTGPGLVATLEAADTIVDVSQSAEVVIENPGETPLQITLERVGCGCIRSVTLASQVLSLRGSRTLPPNATNAVLKVTWKVEPEDVDEGKLAQVGRLVLHLATNDPQRQTCRLEINTRLRAEPHATSPGS